MADSDVAFKVSQGSLTEDLRDQPRVGIYLNIIAIAACDTGAFLTAVLQSK